MEPVAPPSSRVERPASPPAAIGREWQAKMADPLLRTTSCVEPPRGWLHAFDREELERAFRQPEVEGVIAHGVVAHSPRLESFTHHLEQQPVFVAAQRQIGSLSLHRLLAILVGEVRDWSEVSKGRGEIRVYLHGGSLQRRALEGLLRGKGVEIARVRERARYARSYGLLLQVSRADPGALVLGLRQPTAPGLRRVAIGDADLFEIGAYPLEVPVLLYRRKGSRASLQLVAGGWRAGGGR